MPANPYRNGVLTMGTRTLLARTCLRCGYFRGATHFQKTSTGWRSTCCSCLMKRNRELYPESNRDIISKIQTKSQTDSLSKATKRYTPWTSEDIKILMADVDAGIPYKEIAFRLNRSFYSINSYIAKHQLGVFGPKSERVL